ncbi:Zn-dependent amino-or carboxypeptidase, M28 family [Caloranaerobacter azorensis DSM 13643]|uniref:Zn-dependent amino-or carboxypeptidase, M28 family n=1 Tax=Caloranaerobacter azorensis DSM 13643 TaxID=1121264 RepID=A0A1M5W8J4_9FIRM|nr:M28 family metallopeptidase [Caloranaerobacter azorensis]SHH83797.1 Zn-dependent amino-or carboxypeptidase, M28 family [Caloranaerobacter azorensis DSM 13643]
MKKTLFKSIIILAVILVIGTALKSNIDKNLIDYNTKDIINFLTDRELEGRLTGTEGSKKAEKFISEYFKMLELEPLEFLEDDSYLFPYDHSFVNFDNQNIKMTIEYENGDTKECIIGRDFLPISYTKEIDISAKTSKELDENSFLLVDNNIKPQYRKAKGILIKTNNFHHYIAVNNVKTPIIQISKNLYNNLINNKCNIKFSYKLDTEKIKANNIVAKIPGKDNSSAIILSAHFDHIGKIGNTIYSGALDNSSGISVLLDLAKKLKEYSKNNELKQDIIICAFNGEESGRQGSKAFAAFIKDRYKNIANINFDCIGIKDKAFIINRLNFNSKRALDNDLYNYLKNKGYNISFDDGYSSDHESFIYYNIPSVTIGQPSDIIHSKLDVMNNLDINLIEKFNSDIFEFLIKNDGINYNEIVNIDNDSNAKYIDEIEISEYEKIKEAESKDLELNQYKYILDDNVPICITRLSKTYNSLEDLKKIFNNIYIPENIGSYKLKEITVKCSEPETHIGEFNKIYTYDNFSISYINNINIKYSNDNNSNKILKIDIFKLNSISDFNNKSFDDIINEMYVDDNRIEKNSSNNQSYLSIEKVSNNNQSYWIIFIRRNGNEKYISEVVNIIGKNNIFYRISINKYEIEKAKIRNKNEKIYKLDWFNNSKDKTIEFIRNINFNKLIDGIFK